MISGTLIYWIAHWVIIILMIPLVLRRRPPAEAMTWLLLVFLQPFAGLFLYVLFGENRLPLRRIKEHAQALGAIEAYGRLATQAPGAVQPDVDPIYRPLVGLAEQLGDMPILGGNDAELMSDTKQVIDRMITSIDGAERNVHMLFYIFEDDEMGQRVAKALERAAQRGVRCRVLLDAVGSWSALGSMSDQMRDAGIELRQALAVRPWRRRLARLDLRNHCKLMVIDGREAYTGSQNIVDPGHGAKDLVWRDVMVRLVGPIVAQMQILFIRDWYFETDQILDTTDVILDPTLGGDVTVQALPSGPTYPTHNYQKFVVSAVHAARERLIITTPYFVPDEPFLSALCTAAIKGVAVELIVPHHSDQWLPTVAGRAYYETLLEAGVRIHLHHDGLLHAKTMTIDDAMALVGSGNFDIRSFYLNFELNLLFHGPAFTAQVRALQHQYMLGADVLDPGVWAQRSVLRRLGQDAAKLLSPLL
jgi:cardiolipin synthase